KLVREVQPDMVITTQTAPSAVLSVLKRRHAYTGLWGIAFSDYHFHRAWAYPRANFYLVNIEEQVLPLRALGVSPERIFRIGLALPPRLLSADAAQVKGRLGIPAEAKVVLVGSGTLGVGLPDKLYPFFD